MNTLYYGDNLEILRRYVKDETVDLVYLDPPFNSNQDYNVLFAEHDQTRSASQIKAFRDTWRWDAGAARACRDVIEAGGRLSQTMQALQTILGNSDMTAYLAMMAPRLEQLRRVMKRTASIYLHCDPTASHYLKMVMDAIFGPANFRNEITWKRTSGHSDARRQFADQTDTLLFYAAGPDNTFNVQHTPYSEKYIASHYSMIDEKGRRFTTRDLRSPHPRPNLTYVYKGYKPHPNGWSVSQEKMKELDEAGMLYFPGSKDGRIRIKRFLDDMPGARIGNLWDDIPPINSQAQERLGYPTQKPEALLERILAASSDEGDVVLDPFCGCGTTVAVAQRMKRKWLGIDITPLAITLIRQRLQDGFGGRVKYEVVGEPVSVKDAAALAAEDPFHFQTWALGLVGARPAEEKRGADQGIDGRIYFHDSPKGGKTKQIILSVKGGHTSVKDVRDLSGVVHREKAEIGVLITLEEPTRPMRSEAGGAGNYVSPMGGKHPGIQILTVEQLLGGQRIDYPSASQRVDKTFKQAPVAALPRVAERGLPFRKDEEE